MFEKIESWNDQKTNDHLIQRWNAISAEKMISLIRLERLQQSIESIEYSISWTRTEMDSGLIFSWKAGFIIF